jgi:hypothetical protein
VDSPPRTFTREEAEALLPEVDQLLSEVQALADTLAAADQASQGEQWKPRANGKVRTDGGAKAPEVSRQSTARQLRALLERIQGFGILVRDIRAGLIDFPSLREGRVVNLCWRRGEPLEIRWWHEVEAGFAGRQAL